jgi:hypothetical protein
VTCGNVFPGGCGRGWLGGLLGERRVRGVLGIRLLLGLGLRCRRGAILGGLPLVGGSWTTSWTRGGGAR